MRIFIIGGTGKTGRELIKQALEQGYRVVALSRKPGKLKYNPPKLKVNKGNAPDKAGSKQRI